MMNRHSLSLVAMILAVGVVPALASNHKASSAKLIAQAQVRTGRTYLDNQASGNSDREAHTEDGAQNQREDAAVGEKEDGAQNQREDGEVGQREESAQNQREDGATGQREDGAQGQADQGQQGNNAQDGQNGNNSQGGQQGNNSQGGQQSGGDQSE